MLRHTMPGKLLLYQAEGGFVCLTHQRVCSAHAEAVLQLAMSCCTVSKAPTQIQTAQSLSCAATSLVERFCTAGLADDQGEGLTVHMHAAITLQDLQENLRHG